MADKLTPKQAAFVRQYLVDFNGAQAAIRAGYSKNAAKEQAARLLTKANVMAAVQAAQSKVADKLEVTTERIERELAVIAFSDMKAYAEWGNETLLTEEQAQLLVEGMIEVPAGRRVRGLDREALKYLEANGQPVDFRTIDLRRSEKLGEESRAVQSVGETPQGAITIKLHDKLKALELLGKRHGMWIEKSESKIKLSLGKGITEATAEMLRQKILGVAPKK